MSHQPKGEFRMLFLIGNQKLGEQASQWMKERRVPVQYHSFAKGTASGEWVDLFGLTGVDKTVIMSFLPKETANRMVSSLRDELYLGTPNTGVAFTVPLTGASAGVLHLAETAKQEPEETERSMESMEGNFTMILAFVNQGYSEEVMAAGKSAGAGGGTVFHSRRTGSQESLQFWGISIQEEREIVLILAKKEKKLAIMQAISEKCGAKTDAHGVIVSLPVDHVAGLRG